MNPETPVPDPAQTVPPEGAAAMPEPLAGTEAPEPAPAVSRPEPAGGEVSALAIHRDPSTTRPGLTGSGGREADARSLLEQARAGQVAWARPTDLLAATSARWAGRGMGIEAELIRRTRRLPVQGVAVTRRAIREATHTLPPLTAFGRTATAGGVRRAGIGR